MFLLYNGVVVNKHNFLQIILIIMIYCSLSFKQGQVNVGQLNHMFTSTQRRYSQL